MPKHYWFNISGYDIKNGYVLSKFTVHDIYSYLYGPHIYKGAFFDRIFLPLSNEDPDCQIHNLFRVTTVTLSTCITDSHTLERFIDHESVNHYQVSMN